jgi:hypothetical protein
MRVAPGRNSRKSPSRFAPSSVVMKLTPVMLPPGRLRLATRPTPTGSTPVTDDRHCRGCGLGRERRRGIRADDQGYLPAKKVRHQKRQPLSWILVKAVLDRDVLALDEACFLQALVEGSHAGPHVSERSTAEKPHHRHRWLLRARSKRPCSRAAGRAVPRLPSRANSGREQVQHGGAYSITSSARASSVGGTVRPIERAVRRFMASLICVGS